MTDLKDIVVILPGITGSVLQKDGKDLWAVSGRAIWDLIKSQGNALDVLKIKHDDPDADDLGDGIKAVRLVEDAHIIPGLVKIDGYTKTTRMITDNFTNVIPGDIYNDPDDKAANLYHFPYDWRRDNRSSAKILKKLLDKRLKRWRESSGHQNAKVILLAHSMGGLVSRYYLEVLGGWKDCKALFTFGTPYRGSLNAVDYLANGYKKAFINLTEVMRSMNSVYQLMPRYPALKIGNDFHRIAESPVCLPKINRIKAKDAYQFYLEIDRAAEANMKDEMYDKSFVICPIAGVQQPTFQSAELIDGVISISPTLPAIMANRSDLSDGDGTVPQASAIPLEFSDEDVSTIANFIAESHGALQNQKDVLLNLLKRLQSMQSESSISNIKGVVRGIRGIRGTTGIGLALDDLSLPGEPVTMKAKVSGGSFNTLNAEINCISHDRPKQIRAFEPQNEEWVMVTDSLEPGLYRVKVQTDNTDEDAPNPVHNLFEVTNLT